MILESTFPVCLLGLVSNFTETPFISQHVMHLFTYPNHLVCTFSFSIIFSPLKLFTFIHQIISFFYSEHFNMFSGKLLFLSPMTCFVNYVQYLTLLIITMVIVITITSIHQLSLCSFWLCAQSCASIIMYNHKNLYEAHLSFTLR